MSKKDEQKTKTDLSPYIVNVQGKDFVTFPGLLAEAHAQGLVELTTDLINADLTNPIFKATAKLRDDKGNIKVFTGYGDANKDNVAKKVSGALVRMAETRSAARALRFACNIDMTALEELGGTDEEVAVNNKNTAIPKSFSLGKQINIPVTVNTTVGKPVIATTDSNSTTNTATSIDPPNPALGTNNPPPAALTKPSFNRRKPATTGV